MATNAERQKKFGERMRNAGFAPVTVWVRAHQVPDFQLAAKQLLADAALELGPLRNAATGKLVARRT